MVAEANFNIPIYNFLSNLLSYHMQIGRQNFFIDYCNVTVLAIVVVFSGYDVCRENGLYSFYRAHFQARIDSALHFFPVMGLLSSKNS